MRLLETIFENIDFHDYEEGKGLVEKYNASTDKEKELIDDVLTAICGYSMPSLIEMTENNVVDSEDDIY